MGVYVFTCHCGIVHMVKLEPCAGVQTNLTCDCGATHIFERFLVHGSKRVNFPERELKKIIAFVQNDE